MTMDYESLEKLVKLRDLGAISQEEFDARKSALLNGEALDADQAVTGPRRFVEFLARAETTYLAVLRAATLVFATVLIAFAGWLAISGLYNISRNADAVKEEPAEVAAAEVIKVDLGAPPAQKAGDKAGAQPRFEEEKAFYRSALDQYYKLFQGSFEKYRKSDDKSLSRQEFDNRFLNTEARIGALGSGEFNFAQDKADVSALIKVMTEAAALPETQERLQKYRQAQRTRVEEKINRTREERYCAYYGYYIDSCISYETRTVPYVETKVSMKLPAGVVSHTDLFAAYHDKFIDTLVERRKANQEAAASERSDILVANEKGHASLLTALSVAGAFMALMFFFLLIAIERHQRKLAAG